MKLPTLAPIALSALFIAGCCDKEKVPKAISSLYSASAKDRNDAALELANCGSYGADKAVAKLSQLLYDENVGVQSAAAYALRKIDTPEARKALEIATARRNERKTNSEK